MGTSKCPWAIKFLSQTLHVSASWLKPRCCHWLCVYLFHLIFTFHPGPPFRNPYACSASLLQRKCLLSPIERPHGSWICGAEIRATAHINSSIASLSGPTFHGVQHLARPVPENFRALHGKTVCFMFMYLLQPAFQCDLPLFF